MSAIEPDEHKDRLKVCIVAHSLIHPRQYDFFNHIKYSPWLYDYTDVLQIYPERWGNQTRSFGFTTLGNQNMNEYYFGEEACDAIGRFRPDLIFVQQEFYCAVTFQMYKLARELQSKFGIFIWENAPQNAEIYKQKPVVDLIAKTDLVVCGSGVAKKLVGREDADVMPQVGLDCGLFIQKPEREKNWDYIFVGRPVPEKGWGVIEKAVNTKNVLKLYGAKYHEMTNFYNQARVHLSPVIDQPHWREQHASFANLEALSCGLYTVTSDSESIVEYLKGVPGVHFVRQNNVEDLKEKAELALDEFRQKGLNREGRKWVRQNLSQEVIAKRLVELWKKTVN